MTSFNPYQYQIDELNKKIAESQQLLSEPDFADLAKQDIEQLENERKMLEDAAAQMSGEGTSQGDTAESIVNCVIEIRQGAGGDEAKIWASDLLRMYMRFIETTTLKVEFLDEMIFKVKGRTKFSLDKNENPEAVNGSDTSSDEANSSSVISAYNLFKYESGVHRVQRVPATESQGRIHTSTASVAVIPEVKKNAVEIKDSELEWQFMRAGGAGGQNVNKVNSAVRLTHIPTGLTISSRQERTQTQNREIALDMLRGQLWEIQEEKRLAEMGEARSAIGRAQRAEKIRTYNYPQNRVTDHRINVSWYNLEGIVAGNILQMFEDVHRAFSSGAQTQEATDSE